MKASYLFIATLLTFWLTFKIQVCQAQNIQWWTDTSLWVGNFKYNGFVFPPHVFAIAKYKDDLYVGGEFLTLNNKPCYGFAKFDGKKWTSLDMSLNLTSGLVNSIYIFNDKLYVGGYFTTSNNNLGINLVKWDGANWTVVSASAKKPGAVQELADYNGELYAAGYFTELNGKKIKSIAKLSNGEWVPAKVYPRDGKGAKSEEFVNEGWVQVGKGGANSMIRALCVYKGELYAGGDFSKIGGIKAKGIAKWNGVKWSALGGNKINSKYYNVNALCVYKNKLLIGGDLYKVGNDSADIAIYDGVKMEPLLPDLKDVRAFAVYKDTLYASGMTKRITGYCGVFKWYGSQWHPAFSELKAGYAYTFAQDSSGGLYIGGNGKFKLKNGKTSNLLIGLLTNSK